MPLQWENPFDVSARLVARGLISIGDAQGARKIERETGRLLEEILLSSGAIEEGPLARFYADELGYPFRTVEELVNHTPPKIVRRIVPAELARRAGLCPLNIVESTGVLELVTAFPTNRSALDLLQSFSLVKKLSISVAPLSTVQKAIEACYRIETTTSSVGMEKARSRSVLIASGDEAEREVFRAMLEPTGHLVSECDSPAHATERLKYSHFEVLLARYGSRWRDYVDLTERVGHRIEVRFFEGSPDPVPGDVVPYSVMARFFFATIKEMVRLFAETHEVPAEAILSAPRLVEAVSVTLGLPVRAHDELVFASFVMGLGDPLGMDPLTFGLALEQGVESPLRIKGLLELATAESAPPDSPIGARILRCVRSYLRILSANDGDTATALGKLRETSPPELAPCVEALVSVLQRERRQGDPSAEASLEVMVVDPIEESSRTLERALKNAGYSVRLVPHGSTAEAELQVMPPDVLIAATAFAGADGYSLCARARTRHAVPTLLIADGIPDGMATIRAEAVGAAGLFTRPLDLRSILQKIEALSPQVGRRRDRAMRSVGSLAQLSVLGVLDLLRANGQDSVVHFWSGEQLARVRITAGTARLEAEERFGAVATLEEVLAWQHGTFVALSQQKGGGATKE